MTPTTPLHPLTPNHEIAKERAYRIAERLGILAGTDTPTDEQIAIATKEADLWEQRRLLAETP